LVVVARHLVLHRLHLLQCPPTQVLVVVHQWDLVQLAVVQGVVLANKAALLVIVVSVHRHSKEDLVNKVDNNNSNKLRPVDLGSRVAKLVLLLEARRLSHSRVALVVKHQWFQAVLGHRVVTLASVEVAANKEGLVDSNSSRKVDLMRSNRVETLLVLRSNNNNNNNNNRVVLANNLREVIVGLARKEVGVELVLVHRKEELRKHREDSHWDYKVVVDQNQEVNGEQSRPKEEANGKVSLFVRRSTLVVHTIGTNGVKYHGTNYNRPKRYCQKNVPMVQYS
jgi:hypothetical protein